MTTPVPSLRVENDGQRLQIFRNPEGLLPVRPAAAEKAAHSATPAPPATVPSAEPAGRVLPVLVQHAQPDKRPYIHPILAPDGHGELTENEPGHHLWQHGLYVGLNDVNGTGFWTEGLHEKNKPIDGSFHPQPIKRPLVRRWADHTRVAWQVVSEWRGAPPQGEPPLLTESQDWCLQDHGACFLLDLNWALTALTDLTFGQYAYGGLFLRMPFRPDMGAQAIDSAGRVGAAACEAQRSKWIGISMPIPGRSKRQGPVCGIAMLDHPTNPEHPAPWRVDGQLGIAPSRCIASAWTLKAGDTTRSRYRLYIFTGPTDPAAVEKQWDVFTQETL